MTKRKSAGGGSAEASVIYLYGVSILPKGKKLAETPTELTKMDFVGMDDAAPVRAIACGRLVCWVTSVPRAEFADELSRNMENLDWLAEMTTRHQAIVSQIASRRDILPARFATVFLGEASLCADVTRREKTLRADLRRIENCEEWGIKVFAIGTANPSVPAAVRTGKDYLQAKSELLKSRGAKATDPEVTRFAEKLEAISVATAEGGRIGGGRRDLELYTSLLVKRPRRKKLESVVNRYATKWKDLRQVECTGPWPPYSFVSRIVE